MRSTTPLNGTISVTGTPVLRGATVDARVVFNQIQSRIPGSHGAVPLDAVVQYNGTNTIAVRGGVHIRPISKAVPKGHAEVQVDGDRGLHVTLTPGDTPRIGREVPRDVVAATCTPLPQPQLASAADSHEFALAL